MWWGQGLQPGMGMKDPVLFFTIATARHLTLLIQCLHCPLEGKGSRKVLAVSAFFLF